MTEQPIEDDPILPDEPGAPYEADGPQDDLTDTEADDSDVEDTDADR